MTSAPFPVEKEFEKNPQIKREDVDIFRRWVNGQPHLPSDQITDLDLILAYHCCERSSEVSKQVLDLNFTLRTMFPFLQNREINKNIEQAYHQCLMAPLEGLTNKGNRILYCHCLDRDPKKFVYVELVRQFSMTMDLWQYREGTIPGLALIINMENFTVGHMSRVDLSVAQQLFYFLQEALFVKLQEFHFINAPSFMDKLLIMYRPFMKKQLLEMLQVHQKDAPSFDLVVSKDALPKDLGGQYKDSITLRDEQWETAKTHKQYFKEDIKRRVNESLRPGSPKTMSSIFSGIEGTFKQLDID